MYPIILASNSPRRKELLTQMGLEFTVIPSTKEEITTATIPSEMVMELSKLKALDVAEQVNKEAVIIGSDTIVAIDDNILGKPKSEQMAYSMLKSLSGKTHQVYTGVTIIIKDANHIIDQHTFFEVSKVTIADLDDTEIYNYINTKEPMDKAGAYAIQGKFAPYVKCIEGDYYTIVGLPVAHLYQQLKKSKVI